MNEIKWIPVKEKLPERVNGSILVTLENGAVVQALYLSKKFVPYGRGGEFDKNNKVIAWCTMPEPYRGE